MTDADWIEFAPGQPWVFYATTDNLVWYAGPPYQYDPDCWLPDGGGSMSRKRQRTPAERDEEERREYAERQAELEHDLEAAREIRRLLQLLDQHEPEVEA